MSDTLTPDPASVEPYELPPAAPESLRRDVERFLHYEAELLDGYDLSGWMKLVAPEIDYRMPIRTTVDSLDVEQAYSGRAFHMVEDYGSLAARMERLETGGGWSERPPSRVRRHISNIRVSPADGDTIGARSNLLFFWARERTQTTLSGERRDVLRIVDDRLYLARRTVFLDHDSIPIPNLSVVL